MQCLEIRYGPAVKPINPVTQDKSDSDFVKKPKFKNPLKPVKARKPVPVEPLVEPKPMDNFFSFYFCF